MRHIKSILVFLFLVLRTSWASADIHDGMLFRSYDVPADQRTSMVVSGTRGEAVSFSDSLAMSFSLKFELNKGKFGYVCRLVLDELLPLDILLSPEADSPRLCVTADHVHTTSLDWVAERLEEWNDVYLKVVEKDDSLVLSVNRKPVLTVCSGDRRHHATAYFGKVDVAGIKTSDVAPMMIADLRVSADRGRSSSWALSDISDLVPKRGISVSCSNQVFLRDTNRRWTKVWTSDFPSVPHIVVSKDKSTIFFVCDGRVVESDVASAQTRSTTFATDMKMNLVTGEFVGTDSSGLAYADMETGQFIRYDRESGEWEAPNLKTRRSVHLHHNTVYLDSLAVQMFGYGQHNYSNAFHIWDTDSGEMETRRVENVFPRYLSAAGVRDGKIYVLGGKGNESGIQGLGAGLYDALIEVDPEGWTARTLWSSEILSGCVPANDLVFEEGADSFLALVYNPETSDSKLQLMRFSMADGSTQALADPIPYRFNDVTSDAHFFYTDDFGVFFAAITSSDSSGISHGEIYMLGSPVLADVAAGRSRMPFLLLLVIPCLAALAVVLRRKPAVPEEETADVKEDQPQEARPARPGIYMLGAFHVIDREGNDMTSSFSPILIQLLAILVLYTEEKGGVTNAILKTLLWPDKSDDRFNNNKGVTIKKLRTLLSAIGDISVVIESGVWSIKDSDGLCDYHAAKSRLGSSRADDVIQAAMCGPLLPEYHHDWLDPFKAGYAELVISRLGHLVPPGSSPELVVKASDARIMFDSLDEEAILQKCQALVALGKVRTAQSVFKHFTEDYSAVMGEDFTMDFTTFLKK